MDNVARIQESLRNGEYNANPASAANDRAVLSGEYSWVCGQLEMILSRKPKAWNNLRPNFKSDTACERAYEQTEDGINEMGLKLRLKGMDKMLGALSSLIKLAEGENKNLY